MPTIDDVYNLLTDPAVGLAHIAARVETLVNILGSSGDINGDTVTVYLAKRFGGTAYTGDLATQLSQIYSASGDIAGWVDPSSPSSVGGQVGDLHNLYNILTGDFPADVAAELLPATSFYVLIFNAVYKTWKSS